MCTIGIDFGTTCARVAVWKGDGVKILPNELGNKQTPSFVAFTKTHRFIGDRAKSQAAMNASNTLSHVKRLIGLNIIDPEIEGLSNFSPLNVFIDSNDVMKYTFEFPRKDTAYNIEEIFAMILQKMKGVAEKYLKCEVTGAVITVPSMFRHQQRQAVLDACQIAGFKVTRLMNEPMAAALAFGMENSNMTKPMNLLVLHMGGGFSSASLIEITNSTSFRTILTIGYSALGGEHFDECMMKYFLDEFKRQHSITVSAPRSLRRLRTACEKAKILLSTNSEASVEIESFYEDKDLFSEISLETFESVCAPLFDRIEEGLELLLKGVKVTIDDVILVGGSTRIPKVREIVEKIFTEKKINRTIDAMDAAVQGVAIAAAAIDTPTSSYLSSICVTDVASYQLETDYKGFDLVQKYEELPVKRQRKLAGPWLGRSQVIEIIETIDDGSRNIIKSYKITSGANVKVSIRIDESGVISEFSVVDAKNSFKTIESVNCLPYLNQKEVQAMQKRLQILMDQDEQTRIFEVAKSKMSDAILYWEQVFFDKSFPDEYKPFIKQEVENEQIYDAKSGYQSTEDITNRRNMMTLRCACILEGAMKQTIPAWLLYFLDFQRKPIK